MQMGSVNSSRELKGLVVVVKIILELRREKYSCEYHFMDIEIVESELTHFHVVAVNIDDGDDEALRWKFSVFLQPLEEVMEGDVGDTWWIEVRLAGSTFLLDEVA